MLEEKVRPYIQNIDNTVLPQPIVMESERNQDQKVLLFSWVSSKKIPKMHDAFKKIK